MKIQKSEIHGAIWTIIINGIIVLLLLLFGMTMDPPPEKDPGIEIAFGDGLPGAPAEEIAATPAEATQVRASIPEPQPQAAPEAITQEDPSIAIEAERKKREKKEQQEQMRLEQLRVQQEQARVAAEKAAKAARDAKAAKANALASGAFGGGGNSASGDGPGGGGKGNVPGNPLGKGSSGGNSWSLAGRDLNSTFYKPSYVGNQEGKVVISITVDKQGNVIAASVIQGTTISEESLREECKTAARKLKFSPSPKASGNAIGEIVYKFSQQ